MLTEIALILAGLVVAILIAWRELRGNEWWTIYRLNRDEKRYSKDWLARLQELISAR